VLLLAQDFLHQAAERSGKHVVGMVDAVQEKLLVYPFPGNVRELMNAIERAVALTRYDRLTLDDLPLTIREYPRRVALATSDDPQTLPSLREVEQRHIQRVLRATSGNKTRAARVLGMDRRTLYRKLG